MLTLEQIKNAILQFPTEEMREFLECFFDWDYQRWELQLKKDIIKEKLDTLVAEARAFCKISDCRVYLNR
ncbi:MAG: hypothetical protein ACM37W_21425 [Actinomycetota bacterium]